MSAPARSGRPFDDSHAWRQGQDALYASAIAEFGPAIARLAAAYESDHGLQQDRCVYIAIVIYGKALAGRWQSEIDELRKLRN